MQFAPNTGESTPVPMGKYRATVSDAQEVEDPFNAGKSRARWKFDLGEVQCLDGQVRPVELTAHTSLSPTNTAKFGKSNLWKLAEACGIDPSQPFDENAIIGRELIVVVIETQRRDGQGIFSKIDGYLPLSAANGWGGQPQGHAQAQPVAPAGPQLVEGGPPAGQLINGANRNAPF